jgi:PBP1b-binding outer membrane lipoprotein LpoB
VKQNRVITGIVLLACLLLGGCMTVPMSYAEWKKAQHERARFAQAGVPYKSPSELRDEAAEMRRTGHETTFPGRSK